MLSKKVIITNFHVLNEKYGSAGGTEIKTALKNVINADLRRGVKTLVVDMANASTMKKIGGEKVTKPSDPKQNKYAVDAIYHHASAPDYLVLLGATDVIPHIDLRNPTYWKDPSKNDPDKYVPSDLPYACESFYNQNVEKFISPTRVIGRIPNVPGDQNPEYLLGLLDVAAKWVARPVADYKKHLSISAAVWKESTAKSLNKIFGPTVKVNLSPPKGANWTKTELSALSHFINCHGYENSPFYRGDDGNKHPICLKSVWINKKIKEGTVASVECCYGAQLYNPDEHDYGLGKNQISICNMYLDNRAYAFFGSTTAAYGAEKNKGNAAADLLCQYFLKRVLDGASLGRAALEAMQEFAQGAPELDPMDLKTLAQMVLLGDPSIHPIARTTPHVVISAETKHGVPQKLMNAAAGRADRRRRLYTRGLSIRQTQSVSVHDKMHKPVVSVIRMLRQITKEPRLDEPDIISYRIVGPDLPKTLLMKQMDKVLPHPQYFHIVIRKHRKSSLKTHRITVLVAKEEGGKIVSYRRLVSR
jgi:hypothetical protein